MANQALTHAPCPDTVFILEAATGRGGLLDCPDLVAIDPRAIAHAGLHLADARRGFLRNHGSDLISRASNYAFH